MSGTTIKPSGLQQRTSATGTVIIAYDPGVDSYIKLTPAALQGLTGPQGPQGVQGPAGATGATGPAGRDGSTTYFGSGVPSNATGANGDYYIDGNSAEYYHYGPKASGVWPGSPRALRGATGPAGAQGIQGIQGVQGVAGTPGVNGIGWRFGTGVPLNSVGANGEYYLDTASADKNVYGPKANNAWPTTIAFTLRGPQGPAGADGTGGGGSTANLDNGTVSGQIPVWDQAAGKYVAATGTSITGDRTPTVELSAATALTFAAHNRRNLVLRANAPLTLASAETGTSPNVGMSFAIRNRHTAINTITFGTGLVVDQPSTGTGTAGAVKIPAKGTVAVTIYPEGTQKTAEVRGEVV